MGGGYFGYKNVMAFSDFIYKGFCNEILPVKTGIDPVKQLAERISQKLAIGADLKIAGFVCPFYEIDETKLEQGFGTAISGVGDGCLENFPRYKKKFDKFLKFVLTLDSLFKGRMGLSLNILMGDTGVINARTLVTSNTNEIINRNVHAYREYMENNYLDLRGLEINLSRFSDMTGGYLSLGEPLSDLDEDGRKLHQVLVSFATNDDILQKVRNEQLESRRKGISIYEPSGFMLNYGLAGMVLRSLDTDILLGTDAPGSYMNYLYHAFIKPEDLFVIVPK